VTTLLNILIGLATTLVTLLVVIFAWNKVSPTSIADFGKGPLLPTPGAVGGK
jgi:hypothetical protein